MGDNFKPVVSVIVSFRNSEEYIGECLDSLLNQTFQNFEVIVVNDGSTDNSRAVVDSYVEKFNGRLTLTNTEDGVALNKGWFVSRGEYVQFLDADDMLTKTALEELHALAKEYDADVVSCENYYKVDADSANIQLNDDLEGISTSKPTLESEDLRERVQNVTAGKYLLMPWTKFIKRNLMTEILFHDLNISDDIWIYGLIFYGKKFLRVPNAVYIRRISETSELAKTPQQQINFELNPLLTGLKSLDKMMNRQEFFKENPACRFDALKYFFETRFKLSMKHAEKLEADVIYSTIKNKFGEKLGEYDVLIPALLTTLYDKKIFTSSSSTDDVDKIFVPLGSLYDNKKSRETDADILRKFSRYFTARVDLQLMTTTNKSDFQILSVSDKRAEINTPELLNRNGVGYSIQSYAGKLKIVFKAAVNGRILLSLKGLFDTDPDDKAKKISCRVDYTKLAVNNNVTLNKLTPAWYAKPYNHALNVKADEEIAVDVEWLPHRSDT